MKEKKKLYIAPELYTAILSIQKGILIGSDEYVTNHMEGQDADIDMSFGETYTFE